MKRFKSFFSPLSLGEGPWVRPLSLLLLVSLFLASCGEQTELEQPAVDNGETVAMTQEIQVEVLPMQTVGGGATRSASGGKPEKGQAIDITYTDDAATRAQTGSDNMDLFESQIMSAYIVQFNGTDPTSTAAWVSGDIKSQLSSGSPIKCNFNMTAGRKNRVYVVANVATVPTVGMTLANFEAPVAFAPVQDVPATGLPMSAMQDVSVGDVFDVFQLKSVLAKLKVTYGAGSAVVKGVPSGYSLNTQAQPGDNAVRPNGMTYDNTIVLLSTSTFYVPANLSGRVQLSSHLVRCSLFAPANAMYIENKAYGNVYNVYLGDGTASDFNFVAGCAYNINIMVASTPRSIDWRVGIPPSVTALDVSGTANCYIANFEDRWYSFDATVMGNGAFTPAHVATAIPGDATFDAIVPSKLNPVSAELLWDYNNTLQASHERGSIVAGIMHVVGGRIYFYTPGVKGNAVIAAKDASGTILWSWHIWCIKDTPKRRNLDIILDDGAGFCAPSLAVMDRNLGAMYGVPSSDSDFAGYHTSEGLLYQWGRKDPFQSLGTVTTAVGGPGITPADAVKNPTTFYTNGSGDWTTRNDNLWGCPLTEFVTIGGKNYNKNVGSKTIYDPCPVGWRVPPAYAFAKLTLNNSSWRRMGRDLAQITVSADTPFYLTASDYRFYYSGTMPGSLGLYGLYWTSSLGLNALTGNALFFGESSVDPMHTASRGYGCSVRCVEE